MTDQILDQLRAIEAAGEAPLMRDGDLAGRPLREQVLRNLNRADRA